MVVSFPNVQGQKYTNPLKPPQNHSVDTHPPSSLPGTSHKCRPILFQEKDWLKQPSSKQLIFCGETPRYLVIPQIFKLKIKKLLLKPPPNNLKIAGLGNGFSVPNLYPKWCYPSLPKSSGHTLWVDVLESFKGRATYSWVLWKIRETWMEKGTSRGEFHFACGLNQPIFSGKDAVSFREDLHPRKTKNVTWK